MAVVSLFNLVKEDLRTNTGMDCRLLENEAIKHGILHPEGTILDINTIQYNKSHSFAITPQDDVY